MNQYFENNENLESNVNEILVKINEISFYIYTDNGVFNKKGLDYGTRLMLECINNFNIKDALDMGCGTGSVGFYLLKKYSNINVDMVDVNNRALYLTKKGLDKNKLDANVFYSDAYKSVDKKYDLILTNPPIHAGKKKVYEIIRGAKDHLKDNGKLILVSRKDQGVKTLIKDNSDIFDFTTLKKSKGFFVVKGIIKKQ